MNELVLLRNQITALTTERDELSRLHENTLKREYALQSAARLAMDALEQCNAADLDCTMEIAALKAVL